MSQYFYDGQFRKYLLQMVRIFSEFEISMGNNKRKVVPCVPGTMSTIAADALRQNSENTMLPIPLISVYITQLLVNEEMRHAPLVSNKLGFTEKAKTSTGDYENKPGYKWEVQQHMAVPYKIEFNVDIATSSLTQKTELLEQILVLFNPGFQIRINNSPFDAHNLTNISLTNIQWSSKNPPDVPIDNATEYSTLTFELNPVWIGTPAKIRKQSLIQTIVTNLSLADDMDNPLTSFTDRIVLTPTEFDIEIYKDDGEYYAKIISQEGQYKKWEELYDIYKDIDTETSIIRIRQSDDISNTEFDVYTSFEETNDDYIIKLIIDPNTLPEYDISPVDKIINPQITIPNNEDEGTRYLIVDEPSDVWSLEASEGDIIEFNGNYWEISFDASEVESTHYVLNKSKNDLYKFEDGGWTNAILGIYSSEYWFIDTNIVRGDYC